jgi:hypothetical protein
MLGFLRVARPLGSRGSTCESVKSVRLFAQDGFELRKGGCGRSLLKQHFAVKFTGRRQPSWRDDAFLGLVFCKTSGFCQALFGVTLQQTAWVLWRMKINATLAQFGISVDT